jgi:hypothetical protein
MHLNENFVLKTRNLKVAVIHDWMFTRRGGERVLEQILNLFPNADLYYLFGKPSQVLKLKNKHNFFPSFLAKIPLIEKIYKSLLPLLPIAIESFNLEKYDLIILMWNTFNEIAVTKKDAIRLLKILSKLLKTNGKILINIDDSIKVNPSEFNFKTMQSFNNNILEGEWKTFKYNKKTNTSISKETISFFDNGILKDTQTSYIKQRYWSLDEINKLTKLNKLNCITKKIDGVEELYLILSKQDYN